MKKLKNLISSVAFLALVFYLISMATEVLTPKFTNRYYVLEDYLERHPEDTLHDVQVFGSCHSYTSFNPVYMEQRTGVSGFVYGNAGEIIPTTYARMVDQFKNHTPKVALVEIWGMNPYETYSSHERVFGFYLANNLERAGLSWAKQEVIQDFKVKEFQKISAVTMNFPFVNYKDRLLDGSLTTLDFDYDFTETQEYTTRYNYQEMYARFKNNGYKPYPSISIADYPKKQKTIEPGEMVEIEPDIVKYIQKIIDLCKENDVELIFYRSPYVSKVNELKKLNHLDQICEENDVLFIDLEEKIQYDYTIDFTDYQHLSEIGANKSTEYLLPYIMDALDQPWEEKEISKVNLITNGDLTDSANVAEWNSNVIGPITTENGIRVERKGSYEAWALYQDVPITEDFWGTSVTATVNVIDHDAQSIDQDGQSFKPIISFRDAENKQIGSAKCKLVNGECIVAGVIPTETVVIRVGLFSYEGGEAGEFVTVNDIQLYHGAFGTTSPRLNLLMDSDLTDAANAAEWNSNAIGPTTTENGIRVKLKGSSEVWALYRDMEIAEGFVGTTMMVTFTIDDHTGTGMKPIISFRDAENKEISSAKCKLVDGRCVAIGDIPEGTATIRVGVFAYAGGKAGDFVTVENIQLHHILY